jgi:predicted DNA-binding ribbon-helix-helix protein
MQNISQKNAEGGAASALISRNITVLGKRTSIRLESQMWIALKEIADRERCSVHDLCSLVATRRKPGLSLTASIRIFLMLYFKAASTEDGHSRAGHGGLDRMVGRLMPARRNGDAGGVEGVDGMMMKPTVQPNGYSSGMVA